MVYVGKTDVPGSVKRCPCCGGRSLCMDTRQKPEHVWRRYRCRVCKHRWNTVEILATELLTSQQRTRLEGVAHQLVDVSRLLQEMLK